MAPARSTALSGINESSLAAIAPLPSALPAGGDDALEHPKPACLAATLALVEAVSIARGG